MDITENVDKNTFMVNIREHVPSIEPAIATVERLKQAHQIYKICTVERTENAAEIKVAIATTHAEKYRVEVLQ